MHGKIVNLLFRNFSYIKFEHLTRDSPHIDRIYYDNSFWTLITQNHIKKYFSDTQPGIHDVNFLWYFEVLL